MKSEFTKLFPNLVVSGDDHKNEEKRKGEFTLAVEKYGFKEDTEENSLYLGSEDWLFCIETDVNENIDVVFQASLTTFCPKEVIFGKWCATVDEAITNLHKKLVKKNDWSVSLK